MTAKYFCALATEQAGSENRASLLAGISLIQDAIEIFLIGCVDHVGASVKSGASLMQLFDSVDEGLGGGRLPFRTRLDHLNRVRVNVKHHGTAPESVEVRKFIAHGREFLEAAAEIVFQKEWHSISLLDEISNRDVAQHLVDATQRFSEGNYLECLIACRKAFYEIFEAKCDVSIFLTEDDKPSLLSPRFLCEAPHYARNKSYIDRSVNTPFDYIVLDFQSLDPKLLKDGLDPQVFWNIWRLTPKVFLTSDKIWLVEETSEIHLNTNLKADAEYVLEATSDIALKLALRSKGERLRTLNRSYWHLPFKSAGVPIYSKASRESKINGTVPDHLEFVMSDSRTTGLENDGNYWRVFHIEEDLILIGYTHEDDIDLSRLEIM